MKHNLILAVLLLFFLQQCWQNLPNECFLTEMNWPCNLGLTWLVDFSLFPLFIFSPEGIANQDRPWGNYKSGLALSELKIRAGFDNTNGKSLPTQKHRRCGIFVAKAVKPWSMHEAQSDFGGIVAFFSATMLTKSFSPVVILIPTYIEYFLRTYTKEPLPGRT